MGQRTQIIIQTIDKDGNSTVNYTHEQWGIGRIMPMYLFHVANQAFINAWHPLAHPFSVDVNYKKPEPLKVKKNFDILNIKDATDLIDKEDFDNNNGYLLIKVVSPKQATKIGENSDSYPKVYFAFLLGIEELCKKYPKQEDWKKLKALGFKSFVTLKEYLKYAGMDYVKQPDFKRLLKANLDFYKNNEILFEFKDI